jgi:hypothetical protein
MIFGSISDSDPAATIIVLVCTLIVLYSIGSLLSYVRLWVERHRYNAIFENMQRSLMQLGIISFGLFLFDPSNYADLFKDALYGEAFDCTHIIILFLMLVFVLEAGILLKVLRLTMSIHMDSV